MWSPRKFHVMAFFAGSATRDYFSSNPLMMRQVTWTPRKYDVDDVAGGMDHMAADVDHVACDVALPVGDLLVLVDVPIDVPSNTESVILNIMLDAVVF